MGWLGLASAARGRPHSHVQRENNSDIKLIFTMLNQSCNYTVSMLPSVRSQSTTARRGENIRSGSSSNESVAIAIYTFRRKNILIDFGRNVKPALLPNQRRATLNVNPNRRRNSRSGPNSLKMSCHNVIEFLRCTRRKAQSANENMCSRLGWANNDPHHE